jgi:hypothetical protein
LGGETAVAKKVRIDMTGMRFGRLIGIAFAHRGAGGHAHWRFRCDCGREIVAVGKNVRTGSTASCGCLHREVSAARLTEHGHRAAKQHGPTYRAWQQMQRQGSVCARWRDDFRAFLADLGERPVGAKLARQDTALPFAPGNCRWAAVAPRAVRAVKGWEARRRSAAQAEGARAPIIQSRSSPAAAAIIRASIAR